VRFLGVLTSYEVCGSAGSSPSGVQAEPWKI